MGRLTFVTISDSHEDPISAYKVEFEKPLTVKEFMEEVLIPPYYGDIRFNGRVVSYRDGKIEWGRVEDILDMEIDKISACGGWTYMSFIVKHQITFKI